MKIELSDPMLYDRLHTLSAEYSVSVELLVNLAVRRLVDDIDFVRVCSHKQRYAIIREWN